MKRTALAMACILAMGTAQAHNGIIFPPNPPPPPVVTPPPSPPPAAPPPTTAPPAQSTGATSAGGHGPMWLGWAVMGFIAVFDYLIICQLEEKRDPERFKLLMCPKTPDWKVAPPFTTGP